MFGTNDYASATLGNISSYDDGTFMGEYRACIDKIKLRCPNTMIIVCVPPRRTAEYSASNNSITTAGTTFNSMRAMIRNMNDSYGFVQVDFSNIWNYSNINVYSADGTHPNDAGRKLMGQHYSRMVQVAPV
jgi:lysophospholipase L1-like esterase